MVFYNVFAEVTKFSDSQQFRVGWLPGMLFTQQWIFPDEVVIAMFA